MSGPPSTTVVPFASLPSCAANCGPLYDANGACVPPAQASVNNVCFCDHSKLALWHQAADPAVCPEAQCAAADYSSIQSWYTSYCSSATAAANGNNPAQTLTTTTTTGNPAATGARSQNQGPGGDWISNHWRWVIGIVILVVAIAGIWIGACVWRRRYLKRKERAKGFGKHTSQSAFPAPGGSTVHVGAPGAGAPPFAGSGGEAGGPGMFMPNGGYDEKARKEKKKWIVRDRT